ncbi:MAG TPA: phage tail sheath subtilisin-like domain-containing protein [Thermoanaerobaculia bacterium]|nr:phage tail sheath subtilisin-like domain-containing protein [Thermoanaerobaculia bacterium]
MPTYDHPGVYIEEQTGPGVISGIGTSTAAFIGPARSGPLGEARRVSSWDDFLSLYALRQPDGSLQPYLDSPRRFYLAHAVRGFFLNGGSQAFVLRIGTARATAWSVHDQGAGGGQEVFRVQALVEGVGGDNLSVAVEAASWTGAAGVAVATASSAVNVINGLAVTVADASHFRAGDVVTADNVHLAAVTSVGSGNVLNLAAPLSGLAVGNTLVIANLAPAQDSIRLASTAGLAPGSVALLGGDNAAAPGTHVSDYVLVQGVDAAGFVTFSPSPARTHTFNLGAAAAPILVSQEFRLIVTPAGAPAESFDNLALEPAHPRYVFTTVQSNWVAVAAPAVPPTTTGYPARLVAPSGGPLAILVHGHNDDPGALTSTDFQAGLDLLRDNQEINLLVVPDAAAHPEAITIQDAVITHCEGLRNRFAILDSRPGAPPSGPGSVDEHRQQLAGSPGGYAALYYPWIELRDPASTQVPPALLPVPPSGHLAGVYARTDQERGVHKAPANTDLRGALALERRLSDNQQGPLNLEGVNVLRIFQGSSTIVVWGARTLVPPAITDWLYVSVRRLLLYLEGSIEEGIRWAVFEPNNLTLWQQLKRTIGEFLTRVWRDGALFGASADKAFYVRIDEALNPPAVRALGRLYIEIGVAAVRPAEFIIVRIGLWDGGASVTEGQ